VPRVLVKILNVDLLIEKYGFVHFSAGDLLRAESKNDTEDGMLVRNLLSYGKIVPVRITCSHIKKSMDEKGKVLLYKLGKYFHHRWLS
jgi:adenylate kinase family enzyme